MIDFENGSVFKLQLTDDPGFSDEVQPLLADGEAVALVFEGVRDFVVFTNKRVIAVNVQGITGRKKDYASLPYNKIQAYSVETDGLMDNDGELDLWFSGLGKVRFEFKENVDLPAIAKHIANCTL
ncbi:PH domain-containing protein [Glycomyces tritici]|uniref:PH domain-containing protein n=1 Tax=Glycomyces tritici TaxID=2665176 RepID=A0ABT7YYG6_9ACTN|nr:PH domain-containing protein [Glycomyces tritici]MDN3243653.1 PH domain-containing protein [Glycomyces tritici]